MWWRTTRSRFEQQKGEGNRTAMRAIVDSGEVPGIIAYTQGVPIGWCSVAPRDSFPALDRSRILKCIDETPVWSLVCFFIKKDYRNRGLSLRLIEAAIEYVRKKGGKVLEAYPVEPKKPRTAPAFAWTGLASAFRKTGFVECIRRSETRPIMRYSIPED